MDSYDLRSLKICQHNIQSLKPKLPLVQNFLYNNNIDILVLNETWLKPTVGIYIQGYKIHRRDSNNGYGGVAVIYKEFLKCNTINTFSSDNIQNLAVTVGTDIGPLTILGCYCPPRNNRFQIEILKNLIRLLPSPLLLVGDLNAHHTAFGCVSNKPRGIQIYDMLEDFDFCILNDGSCTTVTRPGNAPSAIDVAFVSLAIMPSCDWKVYSDDALGSYHYPTVITVQIKPDCHTVVNKPAKYLYKHTNWDLYYRLSQNLLINCNFFTTDNPLNDYDIFVKFVKELKEHCVPKRAVHVSSNHKAVPWWNEACSEAVLRSKLALRNYNRYPTLDNYIIYRKIDAKKKIIIKQQKNESWKRLCSSLDRFTPVSRIWNFIRKFNNKQVSNSNKNDCFIPSFLNKITSGSDQVSEHLNSLNNIFNSNSVNTYLNRSFSESEFDFALNSRKDTTPGFDDIPYILIKKLHSTCKTVLLRIYNGLWVKNLIPSTWKNVLVIPILKPNKDPLLADSYRPISLSSCVAKIFENMVKNRLEMYADLMNVIPIEQYGFRKGRSSTDSLLKFCDDINQSISNYKNVITVFLDVKSAFDSIDLVRLVHILYSYNIPGKVLRFIFYFFYGRRISIKFNNNYYGDNAVYRGVMQGATLSPLLYLLYTAEIHRYVNLTMYDVKVLQYADDLVLYSSNRFLLNAQNVINNALQELNFYYNMKLKLDLNPHKSNVLIFGKLQRFDSVIIQLNSVTLKQVTEHKFLGLVFDYKLSFNTHVNNIANKMQNSVNILKYVANVSWGMDPKIVNMVYKAIVRSHYDYALVVYINFIKFGPLIRKLEVVQNKGLRIITGAMCSTPINSLEIESGIPPLHVRAKYLAEKFFVKVIANKEYYNIYIDNKVILDDVTKEELEQICKFIYSCDKWSLGSLGAQFTKPCICNKRVYNNNDFLHYINTEKQEYIRIYTDGSKTENDVRAAFYDSQQKLGRCFHLHANSSIFTAESYAIYEALKYLRNKISITHNNYLIVTDSLSVLNCLESSSLSYKSNAYIYKIRELLEQLYENREVIEFMWVPSHSGITGNEHVDSLMKHKFSNIPIHTGARIPFTDYFSLIKIRMYMMWDNHWKETLRVKGTWYANIVQRIAKKPWYFNVKDPMRKFIVTINRLRLGHGRFNSHLHRLNLTQNDTCRFCSEDSETLEHIFMRCQAFNLQRIIMIDGLLKNYKDQSIPDHLPSILKNEDNYKTLFSFIQQTLEDI
jgi:ribonuclease HI